MSSPDTFDCSILRAADIRGVAGRSLRNQDAFAIGKAFGTILIESRKSKVYVARDGRLSSDSLHCSLTDGLTSCGLTVIDIGVCPTPMLYFATQTGKTDCGVMVTASHNPKEYNGFKFVLNGRLFFGKDIQALGGRIAAADFVSGAGERETQSIKMLYIQKLLTAYQRGNHPLTAVWDCGSGTSATIVPELVKFLNGKHIVLNATVDGNFPAHAPDASNPAELTGLRDAVLANRADLGLAFDGDSDRLGVFDSRGGFVFMDSLLPVFAEPVLSRQKGASIVADVKCGKTFASEIKRLGGNPVITKTGHSFIKQKMVETHAPLGGEKSGHICFADSYYGYDDALYAALRLLSIAEQGNFQSRLDAVPETCLSPEIKFPCPDSTKFAKMERAKELLRRDGIAFDDTDGVKVFKPSGAWWLLRASNTVPALLGACEADSADELADLKSELTAFAKRLEE
ncbi:MAG TPA: phosphomannomutase [Alphaproteobacteria bacterium]|nr:phosphomannomutase [Alphaproteobacteria bacterium]